MNKNTLLLPIILLLIVTVQIHSQSPIKPVVQNQISPFLQSTESASSDQFAGKKNAALAMFFSALLPGMGELYAGDYGTAKYFTIADVAMLGTYVGIDYYAGWKKDNYMAYAASNGGVINAGKDKDFYTSVGLYMSLEDYNNDMAIKRQFDRMYNTTTHNWKWDTNAERNAFRDQWLSSEKATDNLQFVVGAMILNRVISIINAVRVTAAHNKALASSNSQIYFGYAPDPVTRQHSFTVNLLHEF